jgi:hypothetical protein
MLRFTIRDVLWLTVVVAQCAMMLAGSWNVERHEQATRDVERHFMETAVTWAKERGEPVQFYTGRGHWRAETNGVVSYLGEGARPSH